MTITMSSMAISIWEECMGCGSMKAFDFNPSQSDPENYVWNCSQCGHEFTGIDPEEIEG